MYKKYYFVAINLLAGFALINHLNPSTSTFLSVLLLCIVFIAWFGVLKHEQIRPIFQKFFQRVPDKYLYLSVFLIMMIFNLLLFQKEYVSSLNSWFYIFDSLTVVLSVFGLIRIIVDTILKAKKSSSAK